MSVPAAICADDSIRKLIDDHLNAHEAAKVAAQVAEAAARDAARLANKREIQQAGGTMLKYGALGVAGLAAAAVVCHYVLNRPLPEFVVAPVGLMSAGLLFVGVICLPGEW